MKKWFMAGLAVSLVSGGVFGLRPVQAAGPAVIADFSKGDGAGWEIEDDGVMGGRSKGSFRVYEDGPAVFSGDVSLENNGGFSSVQHYFPVRNVTGYSNALLRIRGDGKRYLFLVEAVPSARHYYQYAFETSGEWQTVAIPLNKMVPHRRGDRLDLPDFPGETLAMVRLMIANGTAESFRLEVERIWLE